LPLVEEIFKDCVRAYAQVDVPLERCVKSFNVHTLNVEHLALPQLGLSLRSDEESDTVDWLLDESVAPVRQSTAKRIWSADLAPTNSVAKRVRFKNEALVYVSDDYAVWERPGFSGPGPTNPIVKCAESVKKKYDGIYRPRKPRIITGKVNGLSKLLGGRARKKSRPKKTLVSIY
jgi:hypothetical protein